MCIVYIYFKIINITLSVSSCIIIKYKCNVKHFFQALLQARLGAYSSESDDGDKTISKKKPSAKKSVETINLIDDESDEENKNKNSERYSNVLNNIYILMALGQFICY